MSVAVFGDVHGRADFLRLLLQEIRQSYGDIPVYSTGDLIDRGPDSREVIDLCLQEKVQAVLGNHETWLHQYLTQGVFDSFALHSSMKGDATLRSYGVDSRSPGEIESKLRGQMPLDHKEFIKALPMWRRVDVDGKIYRICHSGLKRVDALTVLGMAPESITDDELFNLVTHWRPMSVLWIGTNWRDPQVYACADKGVQVFGHTPCREPFMTRSFIALDTGCGTCPPHTLSAVILPERKVLSVNTLSGKIVVGQVAEFSLDE